MLSIKPITNAASAASYYSARDNYYLSDQSELVDASQWYGRGAEILGLSGVVSPDRFLQLLEGRLPSGQQLGIIDKNGALQHRPATDLTFSAPKSFSNIALVGGDKRLIDVHNAAVRKAMDAVERLAAEARITINGETGFEKTGNLIVALFQHTTSREFDAALHDHAVTMNATQRADLEWRSLSSKSRDDKSHPENGFREIIYGNQHYIGLIYNSELARGSCGVGFDIEVKDQYGNFEIVGIPQDYIKKTSKRRNQISRNLLENGFSGAKAAETANLETRRTKESIDNESLLLYWKDEARACGVDFESLIEASKARAKGSITTLEAVEVSTSAIHAMDDALAQLSRFSTQIKHGDLVRMAFTFARGTIHHDELEAEISTRFADRRLAGVASSYYTSQALIQQEKAFVTQLTSGQGAGLSCKTLHTGTVGAVLQSPSRVQIIDVRGLTHEKELIESLVHASESEGMGAYVLHVGRLQSNRLNSAISRDSSSAWKWITNLFKADLVQTVAGFQSRYENSSSKKRDVIVVHDAQKLSYEDLMSLDNLAEKRSSKLVLLNNTRSTEGFCAGSPLKALKDAGFEAIQSTTEEKRAHFDVIETKKTQHVLAGMYADLSPAARQATQVVAITNKDVESLNHCIRAQLKSSGVISLQSKETRVLTTQTLSDSQKRHVKFFEVGDLVTFNPFTKEQTHFRVHDKSRDGVALVNKDGVHQMLMPETDKNFSVTKTRALDVSIGDELVTEKSIFLGRAGEIARGKTFSVKAISQNGVTLNDGRTQLHFSNDELSELTLSHNYVRKPNQLTKNASQMMVALEGYQVNKNILCELSEYSTEVRLFTNDKVRALGQLQKEQLTFTIDDVARGAPSLVYRDSSIASPVIKKDLDYLTNALSKDQAETDPMVVASIAVAYATAKLAEREAAFEHKTLLTDAMVFAMGKTALPMIEKAIADKESSGELIHAGAYWISKESLAIENNIVENNQNEQNTIEPICTNERTLSLPQSLTQGQKDAIALCVTTRDRFTSVQGLAGVGKTTMMRELQVIAVEKGYTVVGLAPMHTSKDELFGAGIESMTVASFLAQNVPYPEKTLMIVDESSMIGNCDYLAVQKKIIDVNARLLFTGDMTQMQSQSSGTPHELTVKTGTQKIAFMEEIIRQEKNPTLKKAVVHASNREIKESFETLSTINPEHYVSRNTQKSTQTSSVITIDCHDKSTKTMNYTLIYEAIANDFLSRTEDCQKNTLVIAHAHEDRAHINALIRLGLQKQGRISEQSVVTNKLSQRSMASAERCVVDNFKPDDVLRFDANYSVAKKGDYFTVVAVNKGLNRLECQSKEGDYYSINPAQIAEKSRMSVYRSEEAKLAAGDAIRLRLTNKGRGFIANKEYTVASITEKTALLRNNEDYLEIKLNHKEDAHWDYSYSATALGAQGSTATFVLALELAKRQKATTHRSHEIDITRPRMQVTVYTENETALVKRLSLLKGDKQSAYLLNLVENGHKAQNPLKARHPLQNGGKTELKSARDTRAPRAQHDDKRQHHLSAEDLNQELTHHIETLAQRLLGKPTHHQGDSLRYGRKGSLSISKSSGLWFNFETGEKGNALHLIASEIGFSDFKDTISFAKDFLNHHEDGYIAPRARSKKPTVAAVKDSPNKRAYAIKLVQTSLPMNGALAERYLKEHRGLTQYKNSDLRFLPKITTWHDEKKGVVPALLSIARDNNGEINHVQVIRLNPKTGEKDKHSKIIKQTYGLMNGHSVELNKDSTSHITHLSEGVETGLSILESDPNAKVRALLSKSNFLNVDLSTLTEHVVFCVDNDGKKTFKDLVIAKSALRIIESGRTVTIAIPEKEGQDFNDVLKEGGALAVKKQLSAKVRAKTLLNEEMKAVKAMDNVKQCNPNELKELHKINDIFIKYATKDIKQISQLKMLESNNHQQINQLSSNYKNAALEYHKVASQPVKIIPQKELELER